MTVESEGIGAAVASEVRSVKRRNVEYMMDEVGLQIVSDDEGAQEMCLIPANKWCPGMRRLC